MADWQIENMLIPDNTENIVIQQEWAERQKEIIKRAKVNRKKEKKRLEEKEMNIDKEKQKEFERAAKPLIEFLRKNFHPHVAVIVDTCSVELLEGICSFVDPESQEICRQKKK